MTGARERIRKLFVGHNVDLLQWDRKRMFKAPASGYTGYESRGTQLKKEKEKEKEKEKRKKRKRKKEVVPNGLQLSRVTQSAMRQKMNRNDFRPILRAGCLRQTYAGEHTGFAEQDGCWLSCRRRCSQVTRS